MSNSPRPRAVTNTAAQHNPIPALLMHVLDPGGIERQEAEGQTELVNSDVLPTEWTYPRNAKEILAGWGVKLGEPVEDDPKFVYAELPAGWRKVASEHSMHSKLVDERGRERAGIFYKAAFYDRRAHGHLNCRFTARQRFDGEPGIVFDVEDAGVLVFSSARVPCAEDADWNEAERIRAQCKAECVEFLKDYPDFENYAAYWDEPVTP